MSAEDPNLPENWNDWSAEEREIFLEQTYGFDEDSEDWEPEDYTDWFYENVPGAGDREGAEFPDVELSVDELVVEDELPVVGNADVTVTVAEIPIPGATNITTSAQGREMQYLREIESGSGSDADNRYDQENDLSDEADDGSDSEDSDGPEGGEEPPLRITIEGQFSQSTAQQLVELREQDELFVVTVGEEEHDEMELHNFERQLSGNRPYAYSGSVEVREWREYEVESIEDYRDRYVDDSGSEDSDATNEIEDWEESGSPEEPNVIELEEGEEETYTVEDEAVRNVIFDESAEGANATLEVSGDDWAIENVGFRGNEDGPQIVADGGGTIDNVYLGDGAESGIVLENPEEVDVGNVAIEDASEGVYAVEDPADEEDVVEGGEEEN